MAFEPALITVGASIASGILGSVATILVSKITAGPAQEEALTKRFMALIEAQDRKIAKLERNLADLEVKIIRDDAWAEAAQVLAARRHVELPPRPKFSHFNGGSDSA
jgi:hypothetical protein